MIEFRSVAKCYGALRVLDEVSFVAPPGEVTLLLGANGAGKTTLIRALLGIIDYHGRILVDGHDPLQEGRRVRSRIGYMPQSGGLHHDLTVREAIDFYSALRRIDAGHGRAAVDGAGLRGALDTRVGDLSGGMRQRLGFALATMSDPQVLVLDEPTASLDTMSRDRLIDETRRLADCGRTVLFSTHAEERLGAITDRVVRLEEGRVAP